MKLENVLARKFITNVETIVFGLWCAGGTLLEIRTDILILKVGPLRLSERQVSPHDYGGPDWTKINNLVFIDLVLHYGQKDLDFEKDEPTKKRPPFKEISAP